MKTKDLTVIETKGSLVERAEQLGEAIRENYQATAALFDKHYALLETEQGKTVYANVQKQYSEKCAIMLPYMEAFAKGLGISCDDVIELNIVVALCKSRLNECTGFIIKRNGQIVVGQNLDTGESSAPMTVLEIGRDPEGLNTARLTSAITLDFWSGINPYGLAKGGCSGPGGDPIGDGLGVTVTLWRGPLFYQCKTVADVKNRVENNPIPGKGANSVFIDSSGKTLWVQQGGGHYGLTKPEKPYCAATGYRPNMNEPATPKYKAGINRWKRFMKLGGEVVEKTGDLVEDVKKILSDHHIVDNYPDSAPCRHDGTENSTQFSIITDLTNRAVHYCGRPCENEWKEICLREN